MAETTLAASTFLQELLYISKDIVWKDEALAQKKELPEETINVELYMAAMKGMLTFDTIIFFDVDVLVAAGLTSTQAVIAAEDKIQIPEKTRPLAVKLQTQKIISSYKEKNDYYRCLSGQPNLGDTEYLYNTKYPAISSSTIPLHELPITDIYVLETNGYLEELLKANPQKKYIYHLGSRRISPYSARIAERFAILYINSSEFTKINLDFRDCYNICRYALLRSMYVPEKRKENELYDNFMAMTVLFMTIQQMQVKFLDADITRDFYDYESLKYVYDSYNVPFYTSIPLEYHKRIIKNINILMRHKGSTRVFFELFDVFNFGMMDVFDFYILKTHKFENGRPIFAYNVDGTEDLRAMYELKFGQVQLYNNPPLELSNPANHIDYTSMTMMDPYWVSDAELLDKLYTTEFNYTESKYVGIRTVFDLMGIIYETCYFFKMLIDNRTSVQNLSIYFSALNKNIDFFTLVMYVAALTCKKYGYEGNLSAELPFVAKVMGFDFKKNLTTIQNAIKTDPYMAKDTELLSLVTTMNINSIASINSVFTRIDKLRKLFVTRRVNSANVNEFNAYSQLEQTLMTSTYVKSVFKKVDGSFASSYADMLGDLNQDLFIRLNNAGTDIDSEIETIMILMKQSITSLKFIEMGVSSDASVMIEHLFKLLEFFKSAKAELTGYEIGYTLAKRGDSLVKFFDNVELTQITEKLEWDKFQTLTAELAKILTYGNYVSKVNFTDRMKLKDINHILDDSSLVIETDIEMISEIIRDIQKIRFGINDVLHEALVTQIIKDGLQLTVKCDLLNEKVIYEGEVYEIKDAISQLADKVIDYTVKNRSNKSSMPLTDKLTLISETVIA